MSAVPISMMDVNELVRQVRFLFVELLPGQYLRHEACCDALAYEVLLFFLRQYLRHEGYCDALEAFEASAALPCGGKGQEDTDEVLRDREREGETDRQRER